MTLRQFSKNLNDLNKKGMEEISEIILREMTLRFLTKVIQLTPVGKSKYVQRRIRKENGEYLKYVKGKHKGKIKTKRANSYTGGTLRRGWIVRNEKQAISNKAKPTQAEIESFVKGLKFIKVGKSYKIKVVNPVYYAKFVNYGHRKRIRKGKYIPPSQRWKGSSGWVEGYFFVEKAEKYINNNYNTVFKILYERELKRRLGL